MTAEYQRTLQRYFQVEAESQRLDAEKHQLILKLAGMDSMPKKESDEEKPRGYSLKDACSYVGLPKSTFCDRVRKGDIAQPLKDGKKAIYLREDLDSYLSNLKKGDR